MRSHSKCPWIRVQDFLETSIWVSFENSVTETSLRHDQKLELAELHESGLMLKLPRKACSVGHFVTISLGTCTVKPFEPEDSPKIVEALHATAKVLEAEPTDDGCQIITLKFIQYPELRWKKFIKDIARRQQAIDERVRRIQE